MHVWGGFDSGALVWKAFLVWEKPLLANMPSSRQDLWGNTVFLRRQVINVCMEMVKQTLLQKTMVAQSQAQCIVMGPRQ